LNDYFDRSRTIVVTTHQVEEIQHVLTDLVFINYRRMVLACSIEEFEARYLELMVHPEHLATARSLKPIQVRQVFVAVSCCTTVPIAEKSRRLFWKSLPVSDLTVGLSKVTVPAVILPAPGVIGCICCRRRSNHEPSYDERTDCGNVAAFPGRNCLSLLLAHHSGRGIRPLHWQQVQFPSRRHRHHVICRCDGSLLCAYKKSVGILSEEN